MVSRNGILKLLGEAPIWSEEEAAPYNSGSEPITGPEDPHYPLDKILAALERTSQDDLNKRSTDDQTVGDRLAGLYWHEAYHVGQTDYLHQLAGKNDKVI